MRLDSKTTPGKHLARLPSGPYLLLPFDLPFDLFFLCPAPSMKRREIEPASMVFPNYRDDPQEYQTSYCKYISRYVSNL